MTDPYAASYPVYPAGGPVSAPPRRGRPVDMTVTILELVLLALAALCVTGLALFLGAWSEGVAPEDDVAPFIARVLVPTWTLWLVALGVSIVLMVRGKLAFWVPLVALALWLGFFALVFSNGG
ncbi:hypothetical protein [Nocardioides sp.]|uniref:hypothetical protein n=1 Tax=Nocardioides sp. TaxID=35761 RepID=UPI00271F7BD7|nr:hypothetical protein [Nocardioides sp.]MDO9457653.1 hypothetical protein [Nocardioides sp.]